VSLFWSQDYLIDLIDVKKYSPESMSEKILEILSVSKEYPSTSVTNKKIKRWNGLFSYFFSNNKNLDTPKNFLALDNINVSILKGESLGIIGLNGSGKSTLLQIISGTLQPSTGQVSVSGKVAALLELGAGFNPDFTGKENIYLNATLFGLTKEEIDRKFHLISSFANIGDFIDQPVRTYSSGMYVRLAFAIIVNIEPAVLIIDEALSVGDARFQFKCFSFLQNFKERGGTLILVSHDLDSIARLCDKAILLDKGKLVSQGIPKDVLNEYSKIIVRGNENNLELENLLSNKNAPSTKEKIKENHPDEFNYGGSLAEITDISVFDQNSFKTIIIASKEPFYVKVQIRSKSCVENPIYALTIRNTKGQNIYGQNSHFAKIKTEPLKNAENQEIVFNLSANLASGTYLLCVGITRFSDGGLEVIHRRYDAVEIEIFNADGSFGICNCNCKIEIQKSINHG
jgi:ABC-type polysaccharide/polyol phosphate transport system ATPase subunit